MNTGISETLKRDGYVFLPEWIPGLSTFEVAARIGKVVDLERILPGARIPSVQVLRPRTEADAPRNQYSGNYGLGEFPLHTDLAHWAMPPRYFMLRCLRGAPEVSTKVLSVAQIARAAPTGSISKALVRPRRASSHGLLTVMPLMMPLQGATGIRWDSLFLTPMNKAAEEFSDFMKSRPKGFAVTSELVFSAAGDTLIVDNYRMLHGRGKVQEGSTREIERVYMSELI
jgi:hypothetical protein